LPDSLRPTASLETAAQRYARDWASVGDDRQNREYDSRPNAGDAGSRTKREYVDDANGNTAVS
jgi:hypothetical protein